MGQYQGYERYKDSGVEWLGEIPEHWDVVPLKRHLLPQSGAIKTGPFGSQLLSSEMDDHEVKVYNQRNVLDQDFKSIKNYISQDKFESLKAFEIFTGDFLITTRGTIGKCAIAPKDSQRRILHPCLMRLQINFLTLSNDFLMYLIQDGEVILEQLKAKSNATTIEVIYSDSLKSVYLPTPPLEEQNTIAQFLDHKTSQIDALISKKEALLEKLDEKRTALISHAVTKGLDPTVPMKDSGIEWLGDIPAHWKPVKLKHICSLLRDGTHLPPPRVDQGVPLLSVRNIINDSFVNLEDDSLISQDDFQVLNKSFRVLENDIVLAIVGATLGKVAIVKKMPEFTIQRSLAVLRTKKTMCLYKFLFYFLKSSKFQNLLWLNTGFSAQPGIYLGSLANFFALLPPLVEQKMIIEFLDTKTLEIDQQKAKIQQAIDLLKEYRTALITNAVTGKIDVRQVPIPQP
ncbi:MAG: restriction endonuclease subunit S [Coleofasciculus sp. A1-SPW-01]|uniref:restriction endonuclease subunit S n=1 Tax=Coleofasciculus sp. A1-SPW-01 TaxID=3070819 RepID=UPI0032FFBFE4